MAKPAAARPQNLADNFTPAQTFEQNVVISCPPADVFAAFGRITEIAACIPGAMIEAQPAPDRVEGGIKVRLGPISATFRGTALIERDDKTREGRILGKGADAGERSMVRGEIRYRVLDGAEAGTSRVALTIGYTLKGPLAQFGRPGLVRDVAARMGADFAANLEARLKGEPAPPAATSLDLPHLLWGLAKGLFTSWIGRFRPVRRDPGDRR